ncbi:MAG: sigma 54-interacting transcriptional regulator, partial [candidate division Zixibacteria bacterium]|nr:sigma 54-interacting transcriptional regulator [candidate division Zixibacteria bacterium]
SSGYNPQGYELGLFKALQARERFISGDYKESIKLGQNANAILASSSFHTHLGNLLLLLHKNYTALGDIKTSERYAHDAYAFFRSANYQEGMIDSLNGLGQLAFIRCDFSQAIDYVVEAIELSKSDNIRMARLIGNLGRIEILNGDWASAENNLKTALKLGEELGQQISVAMNHLSLGYLYSKQRQFTLSSRELKTAAALINENDFRREKVILAEYEGELAYEMGDMVKAKKILVEAYSSGRELAPDSSLVTQITRRLAQIELVLDNLEEALRLAQRSYDLSVKIGEKSEVGLSQMVMAEIFTVRGNYQTALEYAQNGLDILRKVGDPYDIARSLLVKADIYIHSGEVNGDLIDKSFEEAFRIFDNLKLLYWSAETRFRQGVFWCQNSNISSGFKNLHEAERIFETISEKTKIRSIQLFLQELSKQAIEKSLSMENDFKISFINELLQREKGLSVSSIIVIPLILGTEITGYVYLDRLSSNGTIVPFGQRELNFAVGFADLISLKVAEYDRLLLEEDNKRLKAQLLEQSIFPNIITHNKQMIEMLAGVQQIVNSDISISIEGETGSGKDLLAKTIHYNSNRKDRHFIAVNCAALPETLLESELFGHKKGAYTGADRDKVGLFEEAGGGTFFLDEIADMPLSIQAKVLRIMEEKEIVRLGDTRPIKVDVRIISATNKDLKAEMEAGRFRQDLYYRLTAFCFCIPALRDRREDIPLLIKHFAGESIRFAPEALRLLISFDWPGNVRELENEIKKLLLLAGGAGAIDVSLLSGKITMANKAVKAGELNLNMDINFNDKFTLYDYLSEYEKRFIIKALQEQSGIKKHAAARLNIPESTLRLKIKQYRIDLDNASGVR